MTWTSCTPATRKTSVVSLGPPAYQPYLRGAPPGLPFRWDDRTLKAGLNFTLTTTLGDLDLLGEVAGGGLTNSSCPSARSWRPSVSAVGS